VGAKAFLTAPFRDSYDLYVRVLGRARPHIARFALVFAGATLASAAEVLKPWPLKVIIDNVLRGVPLNGGTLGAVSRSGLLAAACLALVAIYLLVALLNVANAYLSNSIGRRMVADLRAELFHHLQRLSLSFHRSREIGDLMLRITDDAFSIQTIAMNGLFPAVSSMVLLGAMVAVMLRIDPVLTAMSMAVVPFLFVVVAAMSGRIQRLADSQFRRESRLYTIAHGALGAIHVVQAFGAEARSHREFTISSEESLGEYLRLDTMQSAYSGAVNVLVAVGTAAVIYTGALHVEQGRLSIGDLVVFSAYLASLYGPVNQIFQTYGHARGAEAGLARCFELLALDPEIADRPGARPIGRVRGEVEFDEVRFAYEPGRPILKGISFRARPGETIALVGPTGAGKTTVALLMARFYEPQTGAIRIDAIDIRDATLASLRRNIAVVIQPPLLIPGSLRSNIALGDPNADGARIEQAVRLAGLEDLVARLPQGLGEIIGPGGRVLSEGEAQRVTIARALLKDAPILIMDEPTSALDVETEARVMRAVEGAMKGRTTLVIAHRLSTIRNADRILVLRDGVIEESGTFDELCARDGLFSHLCRMHTWGDLPQVRRQA